VKLYRIETQRLKSSEILYLVKDIRVRDKTLKVRERIGKTRPTEQEEIMLTSDPNLSLEIKALNKRVNLSTGQYRVRYIESGDLLD